MAPTLPFSPALRYHASAWAMSLGTPKPSSWHSATLTIAVASPRSAALRYVCSAAAEGADGVDEDEGVDAAAEAEEEGRVDEGAGEEEADEDEGAGEEEGVDAAAEAEEEGRVDEGTGEEEADKDEGADKEDRAAGSGSTGAADGAARRRARRLAIREAGRGRRC